MSERGTTHVRHVTRMALVVLITACTGSIAGSVPPEGGAAGSHAMPGAGGSGGSVRPDDAPDDPATTPPNHLLEKLSEPAPVVVRRLSRLEYNNTVRDLLGDTSRPGNSFVPDPVVFGFENHAETLTVSPALGGGYFDAAETLAARAVETRLATLAPCEGSDEKACAERFVTRFGRAVWRRPVTNEERTRLLSLYDLGAKRRGYKGGIDLVLRSLLTSPAFVFRIETGEPAPGRSDVLRLTSYEMATRLSYTFWATTPDEDLLAAAEANELVSPSAIRRHAERLLDHPQAQDSIAAFSDQWLGLQALSTLDKDPKAFPTWKAELGASFAEEIRRLIGTVVASGESMARLFDRETVLVNATLAAHYGLASQGANFGAVDAGTRRRNGLLTAGGLLATHAHRDQTSPSRRGKFVREQLFCSPLAPPPPGVDTAVPPPNATDTTRERFAKHRTNPTCAACHALMDPIGLAFEHYDATGAWRDEENGRAIDDSGELIDIDVAGPFVGVHELANKILMSDEAAQCFARQWFRASLGRDASTADASAIAGLATLGRNSVKDLMLAITQIDAFLFKPAHD